MATIQKHNKPASNGQKARCGCTFVDGFEIPTGSKLCYNKSGRPFRFSGIHVHNREWFIDILYLDTNETVQIEYSEESINKLIE